MVCRRQPVRGTGGAGCRLPLVRASCHVVRVWCFAPTYPQSACRDGRHYQPPLGHCANCANFPATERPVGHPLERRLLEHNQLCRLRAGFHLVRVRCVGRQKCRTGGTGDPRGTRASHSCSYRCIVRENPKLCRSGWATNGGPVVWVASRQRAAVASLSLCRAVHSGHQLGRVQWERRPLRAPRQQQDPPGYAPQSSIHQQIHAAARHAAGNQLVHVRRGVSSATQHQLRRVGARPDDGPPARIR